MTRNRLASSAILLALLTLVPTTQAQTWTGSGEDGSWNDDLNWDTDDAPNSPAAVVIFPVNPASSNVNNVNIQSSVQAASLTFTNIFFGNYNLTSSSGQTLSGVVSINVASGLTTTDTINLANVGSGSLLFPTTLTINNFAALGSSPTLVIGPNTVINKQGGNGGIVVSGTGFTTISGTIASGAGSLTKNGTGTLILSGANHYVGGTTVSAGVLSIAADGNLGFGGGGLMLNGGTLQFTGAGSVTALIANRILTVGSLGGTIDTSGLGAGTGNVTTIASIIGGSGPLTLAAHGDTSDDGGNSNSLLTFSGPSTFTGPVTITSGLVDAASSCFANAGNAITITGGGLVGTLTPTTINRNITLSGTGDRIFRVYGGSTLTLGGVIDGSGNLRKTDAGTLLLTNANTYTGGTTIGDGTLQLGATGALPSATALTLANASTLDLNGFSNMVGSVLLYADANISTGAGTLSTNGPVTCVSGSQTTSISGNFDMLGGTTFDVPAGTTPSGIDLDVSANISNGSLTKNGTGTLRLSGNNNYAGGTMLSAGVLSIAADTNLGDPAGALSLDGGTLQFTGSGSITALSANRLVTLHPSGGTIDTSGLGTGTGNVTTIASIITGNGLLTLAAHGDTSDDGGGSNSLLTLSGSNTFTGTVMIASGLVDAASNFGDAANAITITGGGLVGTLTPTTINRNITLSGTGDRIFRVFGGSTLTVGGVIDGSGNLRKTDAGTLLLTGANTYTGDTIIGDGTLQLGATGTLPSATALTLANNAKLDLNDFSNTVGSVLLYAGANISTGTGTLSTNGPVTCVSGSQTTSISGNFDMRGGTTFDVAAGTTPSGVDLDVSANISNGALTKNGTGTLRLSGSNDYVGATQINQGVLSGGGANTVPSGSAVCVSGGATFNLGGFAQTVSSLAGGGSVTTFGTTGSDLLTVGADNSDTSFSGEVSDASGGRTLALTKVGSGAFTLSGANTFTGGLSIDGGTVTMSGGAILGTVVNSATFVYNAGAFGGRLINAGVAVFNSDFAAGNGMENDANVSIPSGRTLTLGGLGLDNEGTLTMAGGTLHLSTAASAANINRGTFDFSSTVPFNLNGATFTNSGAMSLSGGLISGATGSLINGAGGSLSAVGAITSPFDNNGVLSVGSGTLNITHPFTNSGLIQLMAANSNLTGGAITNSATIQGIGIVNSPVNNLGVVRASGGELDIGGTGDTNAVGAQIQASTGNTALYVQGLATNAGTIVLSGGAFDNNNHTLSNTGLINGYGTLRTGGLSSTGMLNVGEGNMDVFGSVVNNGTIGIQGGRSVYFYGNVSGAGSFTGLGTATFLASLSPGNSPTAVSFAGNVDLSSTSALNIELGGTTAGTQYYRLDVAGQLSLGGILNVSLINGFHPTVGDSFDILNWHSLSGTFGGGLNLPTLNGRITWDSSQLYVTGTLSVSATYYAGDFNRDGHVNAADILLMEQALTNLSAYKAAYAAGLTVPQLALIEDVNGDGKFNNADLQYLLNTLKSGGGSADSVPEPASLVLLGLGALAIAIHRRARYSM